jgi:hypothetical protein
MALGFGRVEKSTLSKRADRQRTEMACDSERNWLVIKRVFCRAA